MYVPNWLYYSPNVGRFISEDPIKDGTNWYVYCGNNPVAFVDPSGMKAYWGNPRIQNIAELAHNLFAVDPIRIGIAIHNSNQARDAGVKYAEEYNLYEGDQLITWDNEADAYRHFIWNAMMTDSIGSYAAKIIAGNHEWVSYSQKKVEGGIVYNVNVASLMDINNNLKGVAYAIAHPNMDKDELFKLASKNGDIITSLEQAKSAYGLTDKNIFYDGNGVQYVKVFISDEDSSKSKFLTNEIS